MATQKRAQKVSARKNRATEITQPSLPINDNARRVLWGICFLLLALIATLSSFGKAGPFGEYAYAFIYRLFGAGSIFLPLSLLLISVSFFADKDPKIARTNILGGTLAFLSLISLTEILRGEGSGGFIGRMIGNLLVSLFDVYVSTLILSGIILGAIIYMFEARITLEPKLFGYRIWGHEKDELSDDEAYLADQSVAAASDVSEEAEETEKQTKDSEKPEVKSRSRGITISSGDETEQFIPDSGAEQADYIPPPISLLEKDSGKPGVGDIKANANIIKRTMANFGIEVEMDEISIGPSVTRYALKPAEGVKLSRIVSLQDNLALALAAKSLRMEAPIPGKSLVGIEMPNTSKTTVGLGTLVASREFQESEYPLYAALGKGISGSCHFTNIAKAPHMLIAGATGSGKSVTIHSIIVSLLYKNAPEKMRFIMVDPKRVELTLYNGIPHLLTPVITDAKKAILALKWAAKEMERRYNILEKFAVRDVTSYQKNKGPEDEQMPYIVIIIDELADIMTLYPRELEAGIVRLAQMSRAVGIHLILSTQRPSVEVITGLIKANIPARIALQVPSQIDSRTIIDMPGAEKLLGAGDMLYISGDRSKPERIQSTFISESEVKSVVAHLTKIGLDMPPSEINLDKTASEGMMAGGDIGGDEGDDDELYEAAREVVVEAGKASTSFLQRRLKIGYARAARLIDILEERGVVGPGEGAKPREVYGGHNESFEQESTPDETLA